MAKRKEIKSELAWATPDRIFVKGFDLCQDLLGHISLGDMAFLELMDRKPTAQESNVFNAMAITLVEHGLSPSAIATRLTFAGAPEAMQAAVAAGLCGLGSVFVGSMENAARVIQEALPLQQTPGDINQCARDIVAHHVARRTPVAGVGHHFHKPFDPRAPRLFEIAQANGYSRHYVALMQAIAREAERQLGKPLPVNATGAIAALACELGMPWNIVRGIGVMARAIGLVGHIREEIRYPIAREIKTRADEEASARLR